MYKNVFGKTRNQIVLSEQKMFGIERIPSGISDSIEGAHERTVRRHMQFDMSL